MTSLRRAAGSRCGGLCILQIYAAINVRRHRGRIRRMEPTDQKPLRMPPIIPTKLVFIVWVLDSVALVWLFIYIVLHGNNSDTRQWASDLGAVWGVTVAYLIGPAWKAMKQWPKSRRNIFISVVLTIIVVVGALFWIRVRQTSKLETLFKEDEELERNPVFKKQDFPQLIKDKQNATSLPEYLQQCEKLEPVVNDYESYERQVDSLLGQMQQEIGELKPQASYGRLLPGFAVLRAVSAKDIEVAEALKKEIEFAKQLPGIPAGDRVQFYNANIQPVVERENKIALEEAEILKDAKKRNIRLPASVYQTAGIK